MVRVLVTDGEQRAALAVVRSLGAAGDRVYVCSTRSRSLAGASRFSADEATVPSPLQDAAGFADAVRRLVARWQIDVLLPISEASLLAILPHAEELRECRLPFPPYDRFARICDKAEVARVAAGLGIRVPAQAELCAPDQVEAALAQVRFPLVVKPGRSVVAIAGGRAKAGVAHVADRQVLARVLAALPAGAYPLLLQERIVGPGVGVFLLLRGGRVAAACAHRRIREKPPSGGVSVYRESAPLDAGLLERSAALLRAFDWEGVAMVEYKQDAATGDLYIMEVNGRFWGSLQLAIDAGVDFPRLLLEDGPAAPPPYTVGVRSRWEWGDVDHLLARLRRSAVALALPPGAPGRGRALLDFLMAPFERGSRGEVLRRDDPMPFVRESLDWFRGR